MNKIDFIIRNIKFFKTLYQFRYFHYIYTKLQNNNKKDQSLKDKVLLRKRSATLDVNDLLNLLKEVKLEKNVMIHSGLGRFNKLKNKNKTLKQALEQYGCKNLLIPYFPRKTIYFKDTNIEDYSNRATGMGSFSEYIRKEYSENLNMSIHLSHTTIAIGNKSDFYINEHHNSTIPFDKFSPFYKALLDNFDALLVGVDLNSLTSIHIYEDLFGHGFFIPIYSKKFINSNIEVDNQTYATKTHIRNLSYKIRDVELLRKAFLDSGAMRTVKYDNYELIAINIRKLTFVALDELLKGKTIYGKVNLSQKEKDLVKQVKNQLKNDIIDYESKK